MTTTRKVDQEIEETTAHDLDILVPIGDLDQGLEPHDKATAQSIVDQVKQNLQSAVAGMIELWQHRDWRPLGYDSWEDLCAGEFRIQVHFPKADRIAAAKPMAEAGMSTRDAAAGFAVGKSTIERDRQLAQVGPVEITSRDDRVRSYPAPKTTAELLAGAQAGPDLDGVPESPVVSVTQPSAVASLKRLKAVGAELRKVKPDLIADINAGLIDRAQTIRTVQRMTADLGEIKIAADTKRSRRR